MKSYESPAYTVLKKISGVLNREVLISRKGNGEPDSKFMWVSNFRAPLGISYIKENVFLNLFLPEGSDSDAEKKLFLKRVEARFHDGLWQVRREVNEVSGGYDGRPLKMALTAFRSLIQDYSYIEKGRIYVHFIFNESELAGISSAMLSASGSMNDMKVEHLKKNGEGIIPASPALEQDDISAVTIEISSAKTSGSREDEVKETSFVMGNMLVGGVKTLVMSSEADVPQILQPERVSEVCPGLVSMFSKNTVITWLVESLAKEFIVIYGLYGSAGVNGIRLSLSVPGQQVTAILRLLNTLSDNEGQWKIGLLEVIRLKDLIEEDR